MNKVMKNEKGFTLLEIIVVLAVLGALAAMLSPVVFRYIDDAAQARAAADTRTIAAAIQRFYTDTGKWPYLADGSSSSYASTTDASFLTSDNTCDLAASYTACDSEPGAGSATGWSTGKIDSLTNYLVGNENTYASSGPRRWQGPYIGTVPEQDSWGNAYVVNIGRAATANAPVIVVSAGANGVLETNGDASAGNVVAGGDDVIARVK